MTESTVELRTVDSPRELPAVAELIGTVFGSDYGPPMPTDLLAAVAYAGGFIGGAFQAGRLIGTVVAFGEVPGTGHGAAVGIHSHVAAVDPAARAQRIGQRLKWFQRGWALQRGVGVIRWTFDPLVRRNAVINLNRLGATADTYVEDFYGVIDDALNAGQDTDRLVVTWDLMSDRTLEALRGDAATPALADGSGRAAIETPEDIEDLVAHDPAAAKEWRRRQRAAFRELPPGWRITGIGADGRYLLKVPESSGHVTGSPS